jgi:hypothetical protein
MKFLLMALSFTSILLAVVVLFYRDQFLFFIHGLDKNLIGSTSVESFNAYSKVYSSKVVLLIIGLVSSGLGVFISRKLLPIDTSVSLRVVYILDAVLLILFMALLILMWVLPKRLI